MEPTAPTPSISPSGRGRAAPTPSCLPLPPSFYFRRSGSATPERQRGEQGECN
ncbi:MAG: hypothetical protein PHW01_05010 [Patescibacteria group bacterium]|nr:hypothetical protein [Patescibacteria group bacterium]